MSDIYRNLIAIDDVAQRYGCGLKAGLRAAMEAEVRFPTKSAGSIPKLPGDAELGENVTRFAAPEIIAGKVTG
ncbi:hypothetical protein ACG74X_17725 [Marivita sp. S0852]|uniref:hypothetical protein n=1 Tax=Marivita sp. S0852 TaxID=3373893 RepID=UPI0039829FA2